MLSIGGQGMHSADNNITIIMSLVTSCSQEYFGSTHLRSKSGQWGEVLKNVQCSSCRKKCGYWCTLRPAYATVIISLAGTAANVWCHKFHKTMQENWWHLQTQTVQLTMFDLRSRYSQFNSRSDHYQVASTRQQRLGTTICVRWQVTLNGSHIWQVSLCSSEVHWNKKKLLTTWTFLKLLR